MLTQLDPDRQNARKFNIKKLMTFLISWILTYRTSGKINF